jgi:hypothetical protein
MRFRNSSDYFRVQGNLYAGSREIARWARLFVDGGSLVWRPGRYPSFSRRRIHKCTREVLQSHFKIKDALAVFKIFCRV